MSKKGEMASSFFKEGYNCSQSVLLAFCEETGLDEKTAALIASGFGGGIGRTRNICGAVTGMIMAANMILGYSDPKAAEEKKNTYKMVQTFMEKFKEKNGSYICGELLGLKRKENTDPTPQPRTQEYYKKRPCSLLTQDAGDILEEYINLQKECKNGSKE